jgi:hypothetical protein
MAGDKAGRRRRRLNDYLLSGLLRCCKCNQPLHGVTWKGNKYYECKQRRERRAASECAATTVREDAVLVGLAEHLENWLGLEGAALEMQAYEGWLNDGEPLPKIFAEVRALIAPPVPSTRKQDRKRLEKHAAKLGTDITRARGNLVLLQPENIPAAEQRIEEMAAELKQLEEGLRRSKPVPAADINKVVEGVLHSLYSLAYCCRALTRKHRENYVGSLEMAAPLAVRQLLGKIGHITIHTELHGQGTGLRHRFLKGEIVFREVVRVNSGKDCVSSSVPLRKRPRRTA